MTIQVLILLTAINPHNRLLQLAILRLRKVEREKENASIGAHSTKFKYSQRIVEMFGGNESRFRG